MKKLFTRYKEYESKELARRAAKKKRIAPYRALANKNIPVNKDERRLDLKRFTKSIGNPYGTKFPNAKKKLVKIKKKKFKKGIKKVIYYK